jgi:polysaccharide export outer membrane protein
MIMMKTFVTDVFEDQGCFVQWLIKPALGLVLLAVVAGCQTQPLFLTPTSQTTNTTEIEIITLREGDVLKISFPGSANLNTTQPIRRDGMISMPLVGEVKAVGKTPAQLEKDLIDLYSTQLVSKEVVVEVQSSSFPVYVNGSVLHPGKIVSDHPITALEAVMEAGGFDYTKANLKKVQVTRREAVGTRVYVLNLKQVMEGEGGESFYLKPYDIVTVPEKFTWF